MKQLRETKHHKPVGLGIAIQGVYQIRSYHTSKIYIGQSSDVLKRFAQHKQALSAGRHLIEGLQAEFDSYGMRGIRFEILELEECYEMRLLAEYQWIKTSSNSGALLLNKPIDLAPDLPGSAWRCISSFYQTLKLSTSS